MKSMNARVAGFTLMEVMITVAIIAILAAVALPNYFDYVTQSRLVEAKTSLADMRTRMEQYFLDNRSYPGGCVAATVVPAGTGNINLPPDRASDPRKFFTITCPTLTAAAYTVLARGGGPMAGFEFTVDQANLRKTDRVPAGWTAPSPNTCWVGRKNGDC